MTKCSRCGKSHNNTWKDLDGTKHPHEYCKKCDAVHKRFLKKVLKE